MNKTPAEKLKELVAECSKRYDHWKQEREEGCVDPNWSDGANLNLVRNHIIYYKKKIRRICEESNSVVPSIYYRALPPEMPSDFFVIGRKNYNPARIKRILGYDSPSVCNKANEVEFTSQAEEYQLRLF
jgi:hypothetical protein